MLRDPIKCKYICSSLRARMSGPPDALIDEAVARDFLRTVDIAQIDQHRALHHRLEPREIERAELLPFGHDHQRGGALGASIGVLAEDHIGEDALRLLHA